MTSNDRVSSSWFKQLNLDKPFCLSMLDKIFDLQRCGEGGEGRKGGREEGKKERDRGGGEVKRDIRGEERERERVREW